ncbi:uridine diphosphate glucose pyrophosphatase NUDT22 [Pleuronectes platessa]|uniref:uridine diphosphate glucose pyrophosphatase NUDT22 n=1 Tax=Pleuronectes platessa TaxID=8262 RepID=UPI00232A1221|nr:uridine diphosphate glucose pyrophosphatase NUDT22 [Pleuronectes platessa]XP_053285244.1 uridine diphosphate glucose pyrophosphatase NUDT22 [Pleuronectes platessa]XP_053285245.1 uridine diphosphate glucose pyrophosphatase NUDT22 [Pleuronectes platessa]XP_053285246.1 uridine diphosphate glucose pyrophosphatase NUDT22 [Pleuronectes platessa]
MMDPDVSVLLHCADWSGLLESQVRVELSERFNRRIDAALEHHIEEVWTERVSKEPWLFNGAKFRLHSFCLASPQCPSSSCDSSKPPPCTHSSFVTSLDFVEGQEDKSQSRQRPQGLYDSDPLRDVTQNSLDQRSRSVNHTENVEGVIQQTTNSLDQDGSTCRKAELPPHAGKNTDDRDTGPLLTLSLGLTCYKDYLGTNWSCRVAELRQRGGAQFSDPLALLAQPLGVGAVLCTGDRQVVLIRRSQRVAEAGGLLDIPGGHPEPQVVCERLGQTAGDVVSMATMQQRPEAVVSELFASVCAEIRDEVNVPLSCLGEPVLMGVALNHTSAGRPSAEFYVRCSLTTDEVRKLYWKGGAEAHESTDIVFLSREEVLQLDRSSPLWSELCPSAKGAILLYQTVEPDRE